MGKNIVVFGGTGHYGRNIVKYLLQDGQRVSVVSRDPDRARRILGEQVEVIEGDVRAENTLKKALADTDAILISLSAMSPKLIRKMKQIEYDAVLQIIAMAESMKIERLVYLSVYNNRRDVMQDLGIQELAGLKMEVEKTIGKSSLNWTILGCPPMHELFFTFYRSGKLIVPGGGWKPVATISDEDVGRIAAGAATRDDLAGKRFSLTGPRTYSFPGFAAMLSHELGRQVKHRAVPLALINAISFMLYPINPFFRYIYKSLKLLNNFPEDEAARVPEVYRHLKQTFKYEAISLEEEIRRRIHNNEIK